ncbi:hypothetical protein CMV_017077 [Castanea mollissima]|uniref:Spt5 KOW domain-containing protein n=1 Tax=Castanea mollissima TaxID=60419 RepID=A0A8J4VHI7_9ROSI|nr:hypothetical protein CMV_017077 [Castanea mollissima]
MSFVSFIYFYLLLYSFILTSSGNHPKDGQPVILKLTKPGLKIRHRRTNAPVPKHNDEPKDDAPQPPPPAPKHYTRVKKRKIVKLIPRIDLQALASKLRSCEEEGICSSSTFSKLIIYL